MSAFLLGASVLLNVVLVAGYKATCDNLKREVKVFKEEYSEKNKPMSNELKATTDVIRACGGMSNINDCKVCVTRLKFELKDEKLVDVKYMNDTFGNMYFTSTNSLQIILGHKEIKNEICDFINTIK